MAISVRALADLLGRSASDGDVVALIGGELDAIVRVEHLGYVARKDAGISVMFAQAPHVLPSSRISDATALHVNCFHLHRDGYEGHAQYAGDIPGRVRFDDRREDIVSKLGEPVSTGGGGFSMIDGQPIRRWMRYSFGSSVLQFQLDSAGRMDMVSLHLPDPGN